MQNALQILPNINNHKALNDPALSYRTTAAKRIIEIATAIGDKTLVFSHSIPTLTYLADMLTEMKCPFRQITGGTNVAERQEITKQFNDKDEYKVLLISMRAGGLGLNLQGANRVIIFDFSFNPTWEQQAIGRAYRINQRRPVFVYRFRAGGTFEDRLFNTSIFKTQLFGRVVDKKNFRRHASKSAHTDYLFPVKDVPKEDFTDCIGKDPNVLDAIIDDLDFIRSIVLTETFQKEEDEQLTNEEQKEAEEEYEKQRMQRDDPVAWRRKLAAMMAQPLSTAPSSTMPNHPMMPSAPPTGPRSTASNVVGPPFSKDDIRGPPPPPQREGVPQTTSIQGRGSYDDTYAASPKPFNPERKSGADRPLHVVFGQPSQPGP